MTATRRVSKLVSPLAVAVLVYAAGLALMLWQIGRIDHWAQLYAIDDPYIHLAVAKNLVRHGVYGVTPAAFSAASSSIVWPFLLAGLMLVFGVHAWIAFALNAALAVVLLWCVDRWLRGAGVTVWVRTVALVGIVLLTPLVTMTMVGLEHILQALTAVGLLVYGCRYFEMPTRRNLWVLATWATLATSARYEAAFEVACVCGLIVYRRRLWAAVGVAVAGFLPMLGFGVFSLRHAGAHFFPNSLLLKTPSGLRARLAFVQSNVAYFSLHLLTIVLLVIAAMTYISLRRRGRVTMAGAAGLVVMGTTVCQLVFATVGQTGRYEAFLLVLFVVCLAMLMTEPPVMEGLSERRRALLMGSVGIILMVPHGWLVTAYTGKAIQSIYLQQYSMARFFAAEYPHSAVATNDIGAVDFTSDTANLDLFGLASVEVLNAKRAHTYDAETMRRLADAQGVRVVAIYKAWFTSIPTQWVYAGSLTPKCPGRHSTVGGRTIAFYATHAVDQPELMAKLAAYAAKLPVGDRITQNPDTTYCLP
jgi:hypothetical protein